MPRAQGNDLCEIFGYAPDDTSDAARKQWKSQECPFVGNTCIKHSAHGVGPETVYGSCSVVNLRRNQTKEETIICPQRLYAANYASLRACAEDAAKISTSVPLYLYSEIMGRAAHKQPNDFFVIFGHKNGAEVSLKGPVSLSLDWVIARVINGTLDTIIPCEVQSIDITGNYRDNWKAYAEERQQIPNSNHGLNWANVWKRLIPQLILKGAAVSSSALCHAGMYFILPDRVYQQFEKLVGPVPKPDPDLPGKGNLTIMTYSIGPQVPIGHIRPLERFSNQFSLYPQ